MDAKNGVKTKFIEGGETKIYMPPIIDVYTIKEMK